MSRICAVGDLIAPAVAETLRSLDIKDEDAAACKLAERYAAVIDSADPLDQLKVLERFGPKLLAVLAELGATPRARAAAVKPSSPRSGGALASLRSAAGS